MSDTDLFAASFNEKLLLSNGLSISPLKSSSDARSLRECVLAIDNDRDLHDYISSYYLRMPPRGGEPKYEKNPVCLSAPEGHSCGEETLTGRPPAA